MFDEAIVIGMTFSDGSLVQIIRPDPKYPNSPKKNDFVINKIEIEGEAPAGKKRTEYCVNTEKSNLSCNNQ